MEDDAFRLDFSEGRLYESSTSNDPENASILSVRALIKQTATFHDNDHELSSEYNSGETSDYGLNPSPSGSDSPVNTDQLR